MDKQRYSVKVPAVLFVRTLKNQVLKCHEIKQTLDDVCRSTYPNQMTALTGLLYSAQNHYDYEKQFNVNEKHLLRDLCSFHLCPMQ